MRIETVRAFEEGATNCSPLERELRLAGIPVIPKYLVRAHKQEFQPSAIVRFLYFLLWLPRLYIVPRTIEWLTGRQYSNTYGISVMALSAIGATGVAVTHTILPFGLLFVPLTAYMATFALWLYSERTTAHPYLWSWRHVRFDDAAGDDEIYPPLHLFSRAKTAESLGARVLVEYDHKDPFLVAVRGFERIYIGAWNTGDPNLDSF